MSPTHQEPGLDELTVRWEKDGELLIEELDRRVFSTGGWATGVFLYRERDRSSGELKAPRVAVRRYRKRRAGWVVESKVTFSLEQAREVAEVMAAFSA